MNHAIDENYLQHNVFDQLTRYANFYNILSFHIMGWISQGTNSFVNLDTYVYTSVQGTIESIKDILLKGRINDSYALLRKYYDSTIINVYTNLFLLDNFNIENLVVTQIDNWRKGTEKLPPYRVMSKYIDDSKLLAPINSLLQSKTYKDIRKRCNDHTHYNYYYNMLLNDNEIYSQYRLKALSSFSKDIEAIFIQHLSYIFYLNDHYMMSSDYTDIMDMRFIPEEESQYFVAKFIQDIFDQEIKVKRMDLVMAIKEKTSMKLN